MIQQSVGQISELVVQRPVMGLF